MKSVAKTKENLKKCICMKCPSYTLGCKMMNMPANMMGMLGSLEKKEHFEGMYCAFEESRCIKEAKGCLCLGCEIYKENGLDKTYFCLAKGGK